MTNKEIRGTFDRLESTLEDLLLHPHPKEATELLDTAHALVAKLDEAAKGKEFQDYIAEKLSGVTSHLNAAKDTDRISSEVRNQMESAKGGFGPGLDSDPDELQAAIA